MAAGISNPVWPGYMADPFVLRVGGEDFAYGTGGPEDCGRQPDGRGRQLPKAMPQGLNGLGIARRCLTFAVN